MAWKTPIPGEGWSSPIAWGDRIFLLLNEAGETTVIEAAGEYREVARNPLGGGEDPVQASMAVSGGRPFIRTARNLWCLGR